MCTQTVTRFAVKLKDKYYCDARELSSSIWKATLYKTKPAVVEHQKVVMVTVTYTEKPYEVE